MRSVSDTSDNSDPSDSRAERSWPTRAGRLFSFRAHGDEPVDALGIPWRFHYVVSAIAWFNISSQSLLVSFTKEGAELGHPFIRGACVVGMIAAPTYVVLARRWNWEFKYAFFVWSILGGTVTLSMASSFLDELRAPLIASMLASPIGAAYYFKPLHAKLYIAGAVIVTLVIGLSTETDKELFQAVFISIVLACGGPMLIALRRHLVEVVQHNRALSELDALTGAANMRCFERRLAEEISRHDRGGRPFALIGIDLDDFKQVNDRFSHTVGDEVLVASTAALRSELLPSDLIVRRGGDEFLILAPASDERDLDQLARRLSGAVTRARHAICPDVIPTATVAWVTREHGEQAPDLLQRVDDALHARKASAPSTRRGTVEHEQVADVIDSAIQLHGGSNAMIKSVAEQDILPADLVKPLSEDPMAGIPRLAWKTAAAATLAFAVATIGFELAGIDSGRSRSLTIATAVFGATVMAPGFFLLSRRTHESHLLVHALAAGTLAVITGACVAAGDLGPYAAEMFLMELILVPALFPRNAAIVYCLLTAAGYATVIHASGYEPAQMRINNTVIVTSLFAIVTGITRGGTVKAAAEAASLARIDALTGLPNLRRLRARIDDEIRRCTVSGERFGLVMFDLDDFKTVNDRHSHSTGDHVLVEVAAALDSTARHADMPARRGGDEFALVLTDTDEDGAATAVERVRTAVTEARMRTCPDVQPTASVGWVMWEPGETTDDLLARVDQALHVEKTASHRQRDLRAVAA